MNKVLDLRIEVSNKDFQSNLVKYEQTNQCEIRIYQDKVFYISSLDQVDLDYTQRIISLLHDNVLENYFVEKNYSNTQRYAEDFLKNKNLDATTNCDGYLVEINFKQGVTNNLANAVRSGLAIIAPKYSFEVNTGTILYCLGDISEAELLIILKRHYYNPLLQTIRIVPLACESGKKIVNHIDLSLPYSELEKLSARNCWALSSLEFEAIKNYYNKDSVKNDRIEKNIGVLPTDVELEIIAQTWSEHCKHKVFAAYIEYYNNNQFQYSINGLFTTYIKDITDQIIHDNKIDWVISKFVDNAGIIRFDKHIDLAIKVETHNGPSALDPYGGAITGILGANRDILGVGLGAMPIANTDVFCVGNFNYPSEKWNQLFKVGPLHPQQVLSGIHQGVRDGGNQSGIPNVNGAIRIDDSYAGKPLVFCGTIGVLPQSVQSKNGEKVLLANKYTKNNDFIYMCGGRVGKDGIHGATFSSLVLDENSPSSAVQIGDPITQKKLTDFLLEAQKRNLYSGITDNGAGGLSSSVGEMSLITNGAQVELSNVLLKYPGLLPWEIIVSEGQERMTVSVDPTCAREFEELSMLYDIEICKIGKFTESKYLDVYWRNDIVAHLNLEFLHKSNPRLHLKANACNESAIKQNQHTVPPFFAVKKNLEYDTSSVNNIRDSKSIKDIFLYLLSTPNIQSKEKFIRQYDHEVKGASALKQYGGSFQNSPQNSSVIALEKFGGEFGNGVAVACGLSGNVSHYDPYLAGKVAVDEAIRNLVCCGVDPQKIALVDNICSSDVINDDNKVHSLCELLRGMSEAAICYGTPFCSGKDSVKNDFQIIDKNGEQYTISSLLTLLITAIGKHPNIKNVVSMEFKNPGSLIYQIGSLSRGILASELESNFLITGNDDLLKLPHIDLLKNKTVYQLLFQAIHEGVLESVHDISDGGLLIALYESMLGENLGVRFFYDKSQEVVNNFSALEFYFGESSGRFVVSIKKEHEEQFKELFKETVCIKLGEVVDDKNSLELFNCIIQREEMDQKYFALNC